MRHKFLLQTIVSILIFSLMNFCVFAHSGRTDSNGGHRDNINGGYHYHHGYPEHQHPNGECPYLTEDTEEENEKSNKLKIFFLCISPLMAFFPMAVLLPIFGGLLSLFEEKNKFINKHWDVISNILYITSYVIGAILWVVLILKSDFK